MHDFLSACLVSEPSDVFAFASDYFSHFETPQDKVITDSSNEKEQKEQKEPESTTNHTHKEHKSKVKRKS